jgi:hypothetical protein
MAPLAASEATFVQFNGEISPDGRWIAYQSNQTGQHEIYVRPFPETEAGRWQITSTGGATPAWSRSGTELFFLFGRLGQRQMASVKIAPVPAGGALTYNPPKPLFPFTLTSPLPAAPGTSRQMDVSWCSGRSPASNSTSPSSWSRTGSTSFGNESRTERRRNEPAPVEWQQFERAYTREMSRTEARQTIALLAALARRWPIAIRFYFQYQTRSPR